MFQNDAFERYLEVEKFKGLFLKILKAVKLCYYKHHCWNIKCHNRKKRIDISLIKESELIPPYSSLKKQTEKIGKITLLQREIKNGR